MKAIIIGAGRGSRLGNLTDEVPKTLVPVLGRPMLDGILEALEHAGFARRDVVFICGYRADVVRAAYPELHFVDNSGWESNNILLSLLCAREHLAEGFVSTYADIVYRPQSVADLVASPYDLSLVCDTDWRRRYKNRTQHPETDAEKVRVVGGVIEQISRRIPSEEATGEFIGVLRATRAGARSFLDAFDEAHRQYAGGLFRDGRTFDKSYLIDLLAFMLERGVAMHEIPTHGGYMEIDTLEDYASAEAWWRGE